MNANDLSPVNLPLDTVQNIFRYCELKSNNLDGVCQLWKKIWEEEFRKENQKLHYVSFNHSEVPLSEKMIYKINDRLKIMVSMYRNISINFCNDVDRANFEVLNQHFLTLTHQKKEKKFFHKDHSLIKFTHLLKAHADGHYPTIHQLSQKTANKAKATRLRNQLTKELAQTCINASINEDIAQLQNEIILNYFIRKFINKEPFPLQNESLYQRLESSLADPVKNQNILMPIKTLRSQGNALTINQWRTVLDLDPGITLCELRSAAYTFFAANLFKEAAHCRKQVLSKGDFASKLNDLQQAGLACHYANLHVAAIKYYKLFFDKAGEGASPNDFRYAAMSCMYAHCFKRAAIYWKQYFEKVGLTSVNLDDLRQASCAYYRAGLLEEAIKYLKLILDKAGEQISSADFRNFAVTCSKVGQYKEATEYWKLHFDKAPESPFYSDAAEDFTKAGLLEEAAEYEMKGGKMISDLNKTDNAKNEC